MDEPKVPAKATNESDNAPNTGQVMDFHTQTPKPSTDSAPPLPDTALQDETSSDPVHFDDDASTQEATVNEDAQPAEEATANSAETVTEDPVETPSVDSDTVDETSTPAATEPDAAATPSPLAIPAHASHKSGAPVLAITAAVIIALVLAGLVVFTFMNSKKDTVRSKNSGIPASQTASKPLASPADIDATNKEIDASLSKIDDSKVYSAADLSDATLGL